MSRRNKKPDAPVSFQITPMIDMTFLLLVFFMVTSVLTEQQQKKDIDLPEATAAILPENHAQRDVINIDGNGDFFIADSKVDIETLRSYLAERYKLERTPYVIYLRADKNTPNKRVGEFMEIATSENVDRVILGVLND